MGGGGGDLKYPCVKNIKNYLSSVSAKRRHGSIKDSGLDWGIGEPSLLHANTFGKSIHLFSLFLWVNRTDWVFSPWVATSEFKTSNYGLNNFTHLQLAKHGYYGYTPEDSQSGRGSSNRSDKALDLECKKNGWLKSSI